MRVNASLEVTFDALLEQLGPGNESPDGSPMPMKLEAWPGGRWYRDLGDGNGHLWGQCRPSSGPPCLNSAGPLFMSSPVANNLQYRLVEDDGGTVIKFRHSAFGLIQDEHRHGVTGGWSYILEQVRKRAERIRSDQFSSQHKSHFPNRRRFRHVLAQPLVAESIAQSLLAEFETQASITRRFLERLPEDKLTWKPHEKSMTAGQLALSSRLRARRHRPLRADQSGAGARLQLPATGKPQEILKAFDESIADGARCCPTSTTLP